MNGPDGGNKTGAIAISRNGAILAGKLSAGLSSEVALHIAEQHSDSAGLPNEAGMEVFRLPLRPVLSRLFPVYDKLVLFMPVGAAVRLLAPLIQHKHHDPAVVCVDDAGRFVVSLLSGHIGGGDDLAEEVAAVLGAVPVITSASHVMDTLAVDLLGREFGWRIEAESVAVTRASAAVINGERVALCQEAGEPDWWTSGKSLPSHIVHFNRLEEAQASSCKYLLLITDSTAWPSSHGSTLERAGNFPGGIVIYRPRSLVVGVGCRKGVDREHLEELLVATFADHELSTSSIRCLATATVKENEPGIRELAAHYNVPVICYGKEELNSVFERQPQSGGAPGDSSGGIPGAGGPVPSAAPRRLLGVWGVSEPAALLASGGNELLVNKVKTDRATLAVARMAFRQEVGS